MINYLFIRTSASAAARRGGGAPPRARGSPPRRPRARRPGGPRARCARRAPGTPRRARPPTTTAVAPGEASAASRPATTPRAAGSTAARARRPGCGGAARTASLPRGSAAWTSGSAASARPTAAPRAETPQAQKPVFLMACRGTRYSQAYYRRAFRRVHKYDCFTQSRRRADRRANHLDRADRGRGGLATTTGCTAPRSFHGGTFGRARAWNEPQPTRKRELQRVSPQRKSCPDCVWIIPPISLSLMGVA